jgi:hypothetical protein
MPAHTGEAGDVCTAVILLSSRDRAEFESCVIHTVTAEVAATVTAA